LPRCERRPSDTHPATTSDTIASCHVASVGSVSGFDHDGTHSRAIAPAAHSTAHHGRRPIGGSVAHCPFERQGPNYPWSQTGDQVMAQASGQTRGQRQAGEVRPPTTAGLIPDPVQVGADRADTDMQVTGYLRVGAAAGDERD